VTVREHSYLGGADDFMTVRHLVVRASNFDIGHVLGRVAIERYARPKDTYPSVRAWSSSSR